MLFRSLGNLVARVAKLCETAAYHQMEPQEKTAEHVLSDAAYTKSMDDFRFNDALTFVWQKIASLDKFINEEKPWELVKHDTQKAQSVLAHCVDQIQEIAILLTPFLPETAYQISEQFKGPEIKAQKPLFPRL